jgi:ribosomal protein S18 acetylase RimI-like enzyme
MERTTFPLLPSGPLRATSRGMKIRLAQRRDLPTLGKLAGALVRLHHQFDSDRFLLVDDVERGYAWWFGRELGNKSAVLLVAEDKGELAGYCYGRLEERDWNQLLDACGALHDVWVEPAFRRRGIARLLVVRMLSRLKRMGAPRVVLHTATPNRAAQKLFASLGFRSTMIEMTCETGKKTHKSKLGNRMVAQTGDPKGI